MNEYDNYGRQPDLDCTAQELEIYDIIRNRCDDLGLDPEVLRLVRKADAYVSIVMESQSGYGLMDVARLKFTDRAKWIRFGPDFRKAALTHPDDVEEMADEIETAYKFNEPYL